MINLNELAKEIYEANYQWWHDLVTGKLIKRNPGTLLMLVVTELAEAVEGIRKNLPDDKLSHRPMEEVEMADTVIRALDFAGGFNYNLSRDNFISVVFNQNDDKVDGILRIVKLVTRLHDHYDIHCELGFDDIDPEAYLCGVIISCENYCNTFGLDLWGAVEEKRAFNKVRPDHQREARLGVHGKKL